MKKHDTLPIEHLEAETEPDETVETPLDHEERRTAENRADAPTGASDAAGDDDRDTAAMEGAAGPAAVPAVSAPSEPSTEELTEQLRKLATSAGVQALWKTVLPMIGVLPSRPGEYAGMVKVEPVPGKPEATIYIDVPDAPYQAGEESSMDRVLALNVRLEHDYRKLGERHYCVDCEAPDSETRH